MLETDLLAACSLVMAVWYVLYVMVDICFPTSSTEIKRRATETVWPRKTARCIHFPARVCVCVCIVKESSK